MYGRKSKLITRYIPLHVKTRARYHLSSADYDCYDIYQGKKKVIVALAADYGNLGDIAITYAQELFLKACLPAYEIIDFPISLTFRRLKALKRIVTPGDLVTIVGGGNIGDLYNSIEDCRQFIVKNFPNNKIISFPQTIDFSNGGQGNKLLKRAVKIYGRHKDLHLFAREKISYNLMKKFFTHAHVYLAPDISLFLNCTQPAQKRQGIILCIRKDTESAITPGQRRGFLAKLHSGLSNTFETDTHIGRDNLSLPERESALFNMWDSMRRTEAIVTDRLHGMIFAAITGTPCVALQNNNYKIKAIYDAWLSNFDNIRLQQNFDADETLRILAELEESDKVSVYLTNLSEGYRILKKVVIGQ